MALDMGADINNVSYAGKSVLMFACEQLTECENICMWLLEKGADPNIADLVCLYILFGLMLSHLSTFVVNGLHSGVVWKIQ